MNDREANDEVFECFKIFLDQTSLDVAHQQRVPDVPATIGDARRLVTDYLKKIYEYVKINVQRSTGPWVDKRVEFIFSTPTTWKALDTPNEFLRAIKDAGFGGDNPKKHSASLELTEAEAAAVHIVANPPVGFEKGDYILVCDGKDIPN
jgi:hypothetical protein